MQQCFEPRIVLYCICCPLFFFFFFQINTRVQDKTYGEVYLLP